MNHAAAMKIWKNGIRGFGSRQEFWNALEPALGQREFDEMLARTLFHSLNTRHLCDAVELLSRHPEARFQAALVRCAQLGWKERGTLVSSAALQALHTRDPDLALPLVALNAWARPYLFQRLEMLLDHVQSGNLPVDSLASIALRGGSCEWVGWVLDEEVLPRLAPLIEAIAWHTNPWSAGPAVGFLLKHDVAKGVSAMRRLNPKKGYPQNWSPKEPLGILWDEARFSEGNAAWEKLERELSKAYEALEEPWKEPAWPEGVLQRGFQQEWASQEQLSRWQAQEAELLADHLDWLATMEATEGYQAVREVSEVPVVQVRRRTKPR